MFCEVPSSDSDISQTEKEQQWNVAKNLFMNNDTPTPGGEQLKPSK